ncbi:phosphate-starvation-inducible PsiE family protein [Desulfolithobacter sp.]
MKKEKQAPPGKKTTLDIWLQSTYLTVQRALYGLVTIALMIAAALVIFDALKSFTELLHVPHTTVAHISLVAVDRLLLALMFLEIMHTLQIIFGEEFHLSCAEPFLLVGIIAFIRRMLIISLELSHGENGGHEYFQDFMLETVVLGLMVFLFIIAVVLLRWDRRRKETVS